MAQVFYYNPDGTINRVEVVPDPPKFPVRLSKTAFMDHTIEHLGSIDRFMQVFEACRDSTHPTYGPTLRYAYERYKAATILDKDVAAQLFSVMRLAGLITQKELDDEIDNWPEQ